MKKLLRLIALCLMAALLLTGCNLRDIVMDYFVVSFRDMEYIRPDVEDLERITGECCAEAPTAKDVEALMEKVWMFFGAYNSFYTNLYLADIHYCMDLTDIYWEGEYSYCMEHTARVDAAYDRLCRALAASPLRQELEAEEYFGPGYFDGYDEEGIWDETFTAMMEQEAALITEYYALSEKSLEAEYYSEEFFTTYGQEMGALFLELVALRQDIAAYAGYGDYLSFAYDFYHYRDFTPEQGADYLDQIREKLVPLYRELDVTLIWEATGKPASEKQVFDYVRSCAQAMGGTVAEAFRLMERGELYDISYGANKYSTSFEVFLPDYYEPFVFLCPTGTAYDKLTFVHEFGHFCNDYASGGSVVGVDVAEFFSQGLEYLSLSYAEGGKELERMKLAESLTVYVEQAMYASFEHQVYQLDEEELTEENVYALYESVGEAYGFDSWDWDSRDFVLVPHLYTSPLYIISYVVSNDAALQLYQLEQEQAGAGLKLYQEQLATYEGQLLGFLKSAGLESPFDPGHVERVKATLERMIKK